MEKVLATFRIHPKDWHDFQDWAKSQDSNASREINKFVLASLGRIDRRIDNSEVSLENLKSYIDKYLENNIDKYLEKSLPNTRKLQKVSQLSNLDELKIPSYRLLAKRLSTYIKRVKNMKRGCYYNKPNGGYSRQFIEWTKEQDPDGIGWKFVRASEKNIYFIPIDLSNEQGMRLKKWLVKKGLGGK